MFTITRNPYFIFSTNKITEALMNNWGGKASSSSLVTNRVPCAQSNSFIILSKPGHYCVCIILNRRSVRRNLSFSNNKTRTCYQVRPYYCLQHDCKNLIWLPLSNGFQDFWELAMVLNPESFVIYSFLAHFFIFIFLHIYPGIQFSEIKQLKLKKTFKFPMVLEEEIWYKLTIS